MEKIKKMATGALALVLVSSLAVGNVFAESALISPTPSGRAGIYETLDYYGMSVYRINQSAAAAQLIVGASFLDGVCVIGADAASAYSLALDSASGAAGLTVDSLSYAVSPDVYGTIPGTTSTNSEANGCWFPKHPVRFKLGLVGVQSESTHDTLFYVHTSSGSNPGH